MVTRSNIYTLIDIERQRQDEKWGSQRDHEPLFWYAILAEEFGEVANAILEQKSPVEVLSEILQVAAVAVCWAEQGFPDEPGGPVWMTNPANAAEGKGQRG